jgi:hypothetical protein
MSSAGADGPDVPLGGVRPRRAASNPVVDQPWYSRRFLWLRRLVTGESKLDMLAEEVALGWQANDPHVRDLLISLAAKWQASREEARQAGTLAGVAFIAGLAALGFGVFVLWSGRWRSYSLVEEEFHRASQAPLGTAPILPPDHTLIWQALIVTSGAVLLMVAVATLLLKVADRYSLLARQHIVDADGTRRIEAGVRIAMAFGTVNFQAGMDDHDREAAVKTAEHYNAIALKLLEGSSAPEIKAAEINALPDSLKEMAEALGAIQKAMSTKPTH